jgi:2,4-dienoyl-CoA reductase-like NADH-dependent reductase (Old Yellow Enzyme family)
MIAASMTTATAKDLRDYELFSPATVGALSLSHRVVHAPMTRLRAEADLAPSPMMVEYYRQRASAGGLLITESANPSFDSRGYFGAPGIYTDRHVAGWRSVSDAVHAKGGATALYLLAYLWIAVVAVVLGVIATFRGLALAVDLGAVANISGLRA